MRRHRGEGGRVGRVCAGAGQHDDGDHHERAGLVSETRWEDGDTSALAADAGGHEIYVETVRNEGTETCWIDVHECPPPGVLHTAGGEQLQATGIGCDAAEREPQALEPNAEYSDTWTVQLFAPPGAYELRLVQRDGVEARLPIELVETTPACSPSAFALRAEPEYEQYADKGSETHPQLLFSPADRWCSIRVARTVLELRHDGEPDAEPVRLVDETRRWYVATPDVGALHEPDFGPIDLAPAQYEGHLLVELDDGTTFNHPARLLIG
jgi:hypothetical protein